MNRTQIVLSAAAVLVLALAAFQTGRSVEGTSQRGDNGAQEIIASSPAPASSDKINSVFVTDIANVPFADLYGVLRSGTAQHHRQWLAQLEALPKGPQKFAAVSSFFKTLVQLDAKEAIELIKQVQDRPLRQIASDAMFKAAPTSAMPQMAEFFLQTPFRTTGIRGHFGEAIEEWSLVDPVAVSLFFDQHPGNEMLQWNFDALLFRWAKVDPGAALNWWQRQKPFPDTDDGKRDFSDAVHGLVFGWYNKDPSAALDFAVSNASKEEFQAPIHDLALTEFLRSEDDAKDLIERLPTASLKAKTVDRIVSYTTTGVILGYQDPADKRSAETMAKWIVTLPEDAWSDEIGSLAKIWERDNPAAFSAWFAQQSPKIKDRIVYEQCTSSNHENPSDVLERAKNISDPEVREKALVTYALSFGTTPDESIELIRKTKLAEKQKAYLIRLVEEHREDDNEE